MKKDIEAANILLGSKEGARFDVKWGIFKLKLQIRPLTVRMIIRISREIALMEEIIPEKGMFSTQMDHSEDLRCVCRAIAISTGTRYTEIVTQSLMGLSLENIKRLWTVVVSQSDPDSFFFIMVSAKGMNKMKTTNPAIQEEEKLSSVD